MNKPRITIIIFAYIFGFFCGPLLANAATAVYFDAPQTEVHVGDTVVVTLKISSPEKSVNAVEGTIFYDAARIEEKDVIIGRLPFSLWAKPPIVSVSRDRGSIYFSGGVPGGFKENEGEILKIVFLAQQAGEVHIDLVDGFSVFLNDGLGTRIDPHIRPLTLTILQSSGTTLPQDAWSALLKADTQPPEPFEVSIGRLPNIFNGEYFISFVATDKESGIDHYEIKEGSGPWIVGTSPYVLKDQTMREAVRVKAIDKARHERVAESTSINLLGSAKTTAVLATILVLVMIFGIGVLLRWKRRTATRKNA